jgi:glycerophosphoryl diester phosphodiesterase
MILTPTRAGRDGPATPAMPPLPPVIGHRGAADCAPENTLAGLRRARELGSGWVEFDVRLTADGELILLHDERLERTTNGGGKAYAQPLATIRRYDAGGWFGPDFTGETVPTLAEAVGVLAELGLGANVELKATRGRGAETGTAAADLLRRLWPSHLPAPLISSFLPAALRAARGRAPEIARGLLVRGVPRDWRFRADNLGCVSIHVEHRRLRRAIVAEMRESNYSVLAYTVNDPARARELLAWGVTSVFSDVPHKILAGLPGSARHSVCSSSGAAAAMRQGAPW